MARIGRSRPVSDYTRIVTPPVLAVAPPEVTVTAVAGTLSAGPSVSVVQQVPGTSTSDYGMSAVSISTAEHNGLVLFAGWNLHPNLVNGPVPAVYVADSAGNHWEHLGTSSSLGYGSRSAVWWCPNAAAVTWVSCCLTAFASSLAYLVVEVAGDMPVVSVPDISVTDFITVNTTTTTKTFAKTGTWTAPAGVSSVYAEGWAGGGGAGQGSLNGVKSASGGGGAGGEYAAEPAAAVVAGNTYPVTIGAAGAGGSGSHSAAGTGGGNTVLGPFSAVTVTAHGGGAGTAATPGTPGTGSANTVHFDGGPGGAGAVNAGGGGGGGSGSPLAAGLPGIAGTVPADNTTPAGAGAGAGAQPGGGPGGTGGNIQAPGASPAAGPGGGGGAGGGQNKKPEKGGGGWAGQARLTYTPATAPVSLSTSGTLATPDVALTVLAAGNASAALSAAPAGWTALTAVSAGAGANGVTIFPYYIAPAAPGAVSASWTVTAGASLSAVLAAGQLSPALPVLKNPAYPLLKAEAAFGFTPGDPAQAPPSWTDITSYTKGKLGESSVTAFYGRSYELTSPEAGETVTDLDNSTGAFTPGNPLSPFFPYVIAGTQVRVSAWWGGRWHHVAHGYAERWPQEWPDMPQYGASEVVLTDAVSVLASTSMPSAMQGDILLDNPYAYFPGNEQYATTNQGLNPLMSASDAGGLIAVNAARGNQRAGIYVDGEGLGTSSAVTTGQAVNLLGDSGTGFGITSISFPLPAGAPVAGVGMAYADQGLPALNGATGMSLEFWAVVPVPNGAGNGAVLFQMLQSPTIYSPRVPFFVDTTAANLMQVWLADGNPVNGPTVTGSASPQHFAFTISAPTAGTSVLNIYYNGVLSSTYSLTAAQVNAAIWAMTAGACLYGYATRPWPLNFTMAHVAVYSYELPASRVAGHYATGVTGASGSTAAQRVAQIMSWGYLGLPRGGPATGDGITLGSAYDLSGKSAQDSLTDVAASDSGMAVAMPSGVVTYLPRWSLFNRAAAYALGDNSAVPLNQNFNFTAGTSFWSGFNCSVTTVTSPVIIWPDTLQITPSGASSSLDALPTAAADVPVTAGATYIAQAWFYLPSGSSAGVQVSLGFDWHDAGHATLSTATQAFSVPPGTWVYLRTTPLVTDASAVYAAPRFGLTSAGTIAAWNVLYISSAIMSAGAEIAYGDKQAFDYDNTYLYNVSSATQIIGPNEGITVITKNSASQQAYFTRSQPGIRTETTSELDVYDAANWQGAKYPQPSMRVRALTVDAASQPAQAFSAVLAIRAGDVVAVTRRPVGGALIQGIYIVQKVSHEIGPGVWRTSYECSPYTPENAVLTLGTAGYNALGLNSLS